MAIFISFTYMRHRYKGNFSIVVQIIFRIYDTNGRNSRPRPSIWQLKWYFILNTFHAAVSELLIMQIILTGAMKNQRRCLQRKIYIKMLQNNTILCPGTISNVAIPPQYTGSKRIVSPVKVLLRQRFSPSFAVFSMLRMVCQYSSSTGERFCA